VLITAGPEFNLLLHRPHLFLSVARVFAETPDWMFPLVPLTENALSGSLSELDLRPPLCDGLPAGCLMIGKNRIHSEKVVMGLLFFRLFAVSLY